MLFIDNKYTVRYFSIIALAQSRNLTSRKLAKQVLGYAEQHHIIPKSLQGSNKSDNLVYLTAKEHFVCHHLLTKMVADIKHKAKMDKALDKMLHNNSTQQRYIINASQYQRIRISANTAISILLKGNIPWNKGKTGITTSWLKGTTGLIVKSEDTINKQKETWAVKVANGWTPANKGKPNLYLKGKTNSHKGKVYPKIQCPHCGFVGGGAGMKGYHFDKCKLRNLSIPIS